MPNTGDKHSCRCCNLYENFGVRGHRGKDLRYLSKNLKRKFPDLPDNGNICKDCRKKKK